VAATVNLPAAPEGRSARWAPGNVATRRTASAVLVLPTDSPADEPIVLTGSAVAMWDAFTTPRTFDAVIATLAAQYAADDATIRSAMAPIVARLAESGALVEQP
jgi:Coenzyme PQQ synthesis protein D (PqqD)